MNRRLGHTCNSASCAAATLQHCFPLNSRCFSFLLLVLCKFMWAEWSLLMLLLSSLSLLQRRVRSWVSSFNLQDPCFLMHMFLSTPSTLYRHSILILSPISHSLEFILFLQLTSGGGPTGLTILSSSCTLVFSLGWPSPMLMYCSSGGWPTYEESESRAMLEVHSCLFVSADPIPM